MGRARSFLSGLAACLVSGFAVLPYVLCASEPSAPPQDAIDWAKERQFWSFRPPARHARPAVQNVRWPSRTLDHFILARLEAKNLIPSPEADRRTLIRRLSMDLTGLPAVADE